MGVQECNSLSLLSPFPHCQACKFKFRLRDLISCSCSTSALAVCFEGRLAGPDATETGNELSQPKFELTRLLVALTLLLLCGPPRPPSVVGLSLTIGTTPNFARGKVTFRIQGWEMRTFRQPLGVYTKDRVFSGIPTSAKL